MQLDGHRGCQLLSEKMNFSIATRQASVLSPAFFAIYIDDLLQRLRELGVGFHIADKFLGAAWFADDIVLLAPSRGAMELHWMPPVSFVFLCY